MSRPLLKHASRLVAIGILSMFLVNCGTSDDDDDSVADPGNGNGGGSGPVAVDAVIPVDFEGTSESYPFAPFDGGSLVVIDNPQSSGINTSAQVAQMVKDGGQTWGGDLLTLYTAIDFTAGDVFTMKVWSARVVPVLLKFEGTAANAELTATHSGGSAWEELSFDFTGMTAGLGDVVKVVLIFDNGILGDATSAPADWTFYLDDIGQSAASGGSGGSGGSIAVPQDFEADSGDYTFADFSGGSAVVIANPQSSGTNTSAQVGQMVKDGGDPWGGSTLALDTAVDFSVHNSFTMQVYATRAVPMLFKVEGDSNAEVTANHTGSSSWETLTFDFSAVDMNALGAVVRITLIFDKSVVGDATNDLASWQFFFDDIQQITTVPAVVEAAMPTDAPTAPAADPAGVLSVFSDTYTDIVGVDYDPDWSQLTVTTVETVAGNSVLKMANLNYQGIDFITTAGAQDVSGMTTLHFDYWTDDSTTFNLYLISSGPSETLSPVHPPVTGSWQSVDVPLTAFNAVNLADVIQMKVDGNGTIFFDNIYFY
jgi:hypothetical protein